MRERRRHVHQLAVGIDVVDVFNTNPELFFWNVDSRFDGEYHSCAEWSATNVVNVEADEMAESVDEVLAQRLPMQVFAVRVDVFDGDLVEGIRGIAGQHRLARDKRGLGG